MDPALYNIGTGNTFSYIMTAESYAFDRNPNLSEANKNSLFYTFKESEEIETVLFYYIQNSDFSVIYSDTSMCLDE